MTGRRLTLLALLAIAGCTQPHGFVGRLPVLADPEQAAEIVVVRPAQFMRQKGRLAMVAHHIERASGDHAEILARMVAALLLELSGGTWQGGITKPLADGQAATCRPIRVFRVCGVRSGQRCRWCDNRVDGGAIYAAGIVGTIQELYVAPTWRSAGVGRELLERVIELGRRSGWNRIEVVAPAQEQWSRTISFYKANGCIEIGPRLQHRLTIAPGTARRG